MGLRINQNIDAFNSYRNLSVTQGQMSKSLEKLSSGFRINRAADDAAGLAISEGLRSQVGGLKVAVRNAQDGISVVQTAEGALTEVHSILQRMRDLAVQAPTTARSNADSQAAAWTRSSTRSSDEIDRIADQHQVQRHQAPRRQRHRPRPSRSAPTPATRIDVDHQRHAARPRDTGAAHHRAGGSRHGASTTAITQRVDRRAEPRCDRRTASSTPINNLNVAVENLSASESRIRDTDMAAEMMNFTRSQILSQAGTAMLAQANQAPQGVLQLLRG